MEEAPVSQNVQIGSRLRAARLARGLTLKSIARKANLTQGFVSKLERDLVSPSVASLVAICDAVGLRVGELFEPPVARVVRAGKGAPINFGGQGVHSLGERFGARREADKLAVDGDRSARGGGGDDELRLVFCHREGRDHEKE